jgi:hypothetical protein
MQNCKVRIEENVVRIEVLTVASMKITDFWDVAPCSLVETDRHFRGPDDGGSKHLLKCRI